MVIIDGRESSEILQLLCCRAECETFLRSAAKASMSFETKIHLNARSKLGPWFLSTCYVTESFRLEPSFVHDGRYGSMQNVAAAVVLMARFYH